MDYYAYIVGPDGRIQQRVVISSENDDDAKLQARNLVDGHDVELWRLDKRVAQFKRGEP